MQSEWLRKKDLLRSLSGIDALCFLPRDIHFMEPKLLCCMQWHWNYIDTGIYRKSFVKAMHLPPLLLYMTFLFQCCGSHLEYGIAKPEGLLAIHKKCTDKWALIGPIILYVHFILVCQLLSSSCFHDFHFNSYTLSLDHGHFIWNIWPQSIIRHHLPSPAWLSFHWNVTISHMSVLKLIYNAVICYTRQIANIWSRTIGPEER